MAHFVQGDLIQKSTPSRALKKQVSNLALVAEARTTLRMRLLRTWMAPFMGGGVEVGLGGLLLGSMGWLLR
jgi:hypothetical protein